MHLHKDALKFLCFDRQTVLVLCWSIGLTLGIYFGFEIASPISSYLWQAGRTALKFPIITTVFPIVLIWLFVWRALPGMIYPIIFMKAFTDGIVMVGIAYAFGSATWLFGPIYLISDRLATVICLFFAARCLESGGFKMHRCFALCLATTITASLLDYAFISPYFASLML